MKKGNKNLILFSVVFVLIIGIIYMWNINMGKTSTQVKETISFLEELSEIGAINGEIVPVASDIQEVKTSSNGNATVGYTLKWHNCGVDLDKNYNVIGFLEQTTTKTGETVLSEEQCIDYAEKYLKHILDNDFELKEVLYDTPYENEMPEIQEQYDMVSQKIIKETKMVDDVWALLEMTPYRYKTSQAGLDRVKELERLEVTFEFVVTVYKKI